MPMIIWVKYLLEAQGYTVSDNFLHQDNQSSIKLEQNGKALSRKRTRHIAIRYYFVMDRIAGGDLRVEYCPAEKMLAGFFTKPLQGKLFRLFRSMIMNIHQTDFPQYFEYSIAYDSMTTGDNGTMSGSTQECVGKHTKLTDKQTGMETQKWTFIDVIKKGKLPRDLLNMGPVEQLKEVFGKELNRLCRAS